MESSARACLQVGLAEMKAAVDMSGGMVVQTDTFHNPVFKESFKRVFAPPGAPGSLEVASNATFEVNFCDLTSCPGGSFWSSSCPDAQPATLKASSRS